MSKRDDLWKEQVHRTNYLWRNRRRMAWIAFVSIIVVTGLCFFVVDIERLEKLETVVTWFYMAMASIVGAYMGFATYASVAMKDNYMENSSSYGNEEESPPTDGSDVTPDNPDEPPPTPRKRRQRVPKLSSFE